MKSFRSVDSFISESLHKAELQVLRDIILESGLKETVKWGSPIYTFEGKNMVGIGSFKSYFGIWFFQGALLKDKTKKLINAQEGKTKALRQWRFTTPDEIDPKLISAYINESKDHQLAGHAIKPEKKPLVMPRILTEALNKHQLSEAFENFSLSHKREYTDYIREAKRDETKLRRIEKIIPMIRGKSGLNDKYR